MAEVINDDSNTQPRSMPVSTPSTPSGTEQAQPKIVKSGRKSRFNTIDDMIILQEVAAAKAHIAPHGEMYSRFKQAALKVRGNPQFSTTVNGKSLQDRFNRLVEDFQARDAKDRVLSGVGGEIGEMDELLSDMVESKRDFDTRKRGDAEEKTEQEQRKIAAGKELVLNSLKNKVRRKDGVSSSESEDSKEAMPKKRRVMALDDGDGMRTFGEAIKESDLARCEVEKERLQLEVRGFEQEVKDRTSERAERLQEREERREESQAQRELINQMREDSAKQLNAVLALVGKVLETKK